MTGSKHTWCKEPQKVCKRASVFFVDQSDQWGRRKGLGLNEKANL